MTPAPPPTSFSLTESLLVVCKVSRASRASALAWLLSARAAGRLLFPSAAADAGELRVLLSEWLPAHAAAARA